ncbi:MAG: GNAT family N-acetyltransferase [Planctomycetota bacterium]|nr:GNAT family N-acetyltransferase [Planctomycetota bacterium]MDA1162036.1 GNAT family N-acetyltransferase [Planctomycetota bacterium]
MPISIVDADFRRLEHCRGLVRILDEYARLPHIADRGIPDAVRENLVERLAANSGRQVLLAVDDEHIDGEQVVGVAVCFEGFSTFAGRPLLNVHDLAVTADCRGQGVGTLLLDAIARRAQELGCCRVTLEVASDNPGAKRLYERSGFAMAQEFWKKELT